MSETITVEISSTNYELPKDFGSTFKDLCAYLPVQYQDYDHLTRLDEERGMWVSMGEEPLILEDGGVYALSQLAEKDTY